MLDKKDFSTIGSLIQENIKSALQEFFDTLILPYFEHNEKDHEEIRKTLREHDKRFDSMDAEFDSIQRKLEKNEDDHDEIFQKLDGIEKHLINHEERIRRVKAVVSS